MTSILTAFGGIDLQKANPVLSGAYQDHDCVTVGYLNDASSEISLRSRFHGAGQVSRFSESLLHPRNNAINRNRESQTKIPAPLRR